MVRNTGSDARCYVLWIKNGARGNSSKAIPHRIDKVLIHHVRCLNLRMEGRQEYQSRQDLRSTNSSQEIVISTVILWLCLYSRGYDIYFDVPSVNGSVCHDDLSVYVGTCWLLFQQ